VKTRPIKLVFPVGGLVRRWSYQAQPPYTTPVAMNVWPIGPANMRLRGARRAGMEKMTGGSAGGNHFRCLAPVPKADDSDYTYRLMCAAGQKWYYPVNGGTMTEWVTGTLASSTGRVGWAVIDSLLYYLDAGTFKKMDPFAPSLANLVAAAGALPTDCDLLCRYNGRLTAAPFRGQLWYMARQSDPTDWDYTADSDDPQRAVWSASCDLGSLQDPLCAFAPLGDTELVFGCDNSMWVLRNDPCWGGAIDNVSRELGIVGPDAWCYTPDKSLLFVDFSGVYILPPRANSPQPFSREKLPSDLRNMDPGTYDVVLRYDPQHFGFLLGLVPLTGASESDPGEHWWIDWPTQSFWQISFPTAKTPRFYEEFHYEAGTDDVLALGCEDGVLRMFDDDGDDDGDDVTGYCSIGPFQLGDAYHEGMLRELIGVLGKTSGDLTWKLFTADDAETCALASTAKDTGTWSGGRNRSKHPRRRGQAAVLQLYGTECWEFEQAVAVLTTLGKHR